MTTTALDLITGAAKLNGVLFKNEQLSDDEANDGLVLLNDMLDTWSSEVGAIYADTVETFTLTGASSYTIGTGGTLNTTRPINILSVLVRISGFDYKLEPLDTYQFQTQIGAKSVSSQVPEYYTYDNNYPLATLTMYTIPTSGGTLVLQSNKPLSNLATLATAVSLPPGWKRAIKSNLALDMGPQYGVEVPDLVVDMARKSLAAIKRAVSINNPMPLLPSKSRRGNIITDI